MNRENGKTGVSRWRVGACGKSWRHGRKKRKKEEEISDSEPATTKIVLERYISPSLAISPELSSKPPVTFNFIRLHSLSLRAVHVLWVRTDVRRLRSLNWLSGPLPVHIRRSPPKRGGGGGGADGCAQANKGTSLTIRTRGPRSRHDRKLFQIIFPVFFHFCTCGTSATVKVLPLNNILTVFNTGPSWIQRQWCAWPLWRKSLEWKTSRWTIQTRKPLRHRR